MCAVFRFLFGVLVVFLLFDHVFGVGGIARIMLPKRPALLGGLW